MPYHEIFTSLGRDSVCYAEKKVSCGDFDKNTCIKLGCCFDGALCYESKSAKFGK